MSLPLPPLLPDNVVPKQIDQLNRLAIAQAAAFQLVRQVGDAAAPTIFVGQDFHGLTHGHASPDDIRLDLVSVNLVVSHGLCRVVPSLGGEAGALVTVGGASLGDGE